MYLAVSEYEVVRIVAEVIAILGFVGSLFYAILKNLWKSHRLQEENARKAEQGLTKNAEATTAIKEQLVKLNGHVQDHSLLDDGRFHGISQRLAHIEGLLKMPLGGGEEEP